MQWIISPITKNASNLTQSCMHQCTIRKRHETDECSVDCYLTDILAHEWTQGFLDRIWFGFEQTERLLYNPGLVLISPAALHCEACCIRLPGLCYRAAVCHGLFNMEVSSQGHPNQTAVVLCSLWGHGGAWGINMPKCVCVRLSVCGARNDGSGKAPSLTPLHGIGWDFPVPDSAVGVW